MRFPRHLGTGDYLSGLPGISCVCEGQGASTASARELCRGSSGLRLSHAAHHVGANVCLVRGPGRDDVTGQKWCPEPSRKRAFMSTVCQVPLWFPIPSVASTMYLHLVGCGWEDWQLEPSA